MALADLRTENSNVRSMWQTWVKQLVANYSSMAQSLLTHCTAKSSIVDGLRIDSSAEIETSFFQPFLSAAGVYGVGEVDNGDPKYVCPYQNYIDGVLNYPA